MSALSDRFWMKVQKTESCWLWTAAKTRDGYGTFNSPRPFKTNLAHRLTFLDNGGVIEDGFTLDHLCRTKNCVNPAHLESVSRRVNIQRAWDVKRAQQMEVAA